MSLKFRKLFSLKSVDTAESGTGDHENYFVQLDLSKYTMVHQNGSRIDADCESKAVRIRNISNHTFWPNIPRTTLLFSKNENYDNKTTLEDKGDIDDFVDSIGSFSKAVKPNYG